jgi:dTMP kinase
MNPTRMRGPLIVLEGIDGSGKSTVARRLAGRWRQRGLPVRLRREPGLSGFGRAALARARSDPWGSAAIFTLDRLLARSSIEQQLAAGRIVLQDRSYLSTLAYQASRLPEAERRRWEQLQERIALRPDRVLWLDVPPSLAIRRIRGRAGRRATVERLAFLRKVRAAYLDLEDPSRWSRVDASRPLDEVVAEADRKLAPWLVRSERSRRPRRQP